MISDDSISLLISFHLVWKLLEAIVKILLDYQGRLSL